MKIYLGSSVYNGMSVATHVSIMNLVRTVAQLPDVELIDGYLVGCAEIALARSIAATNFLKSDADVLLTVDADMRFRAVDAVRLCKLAMGKYPIVGGFYKTRSLGEKQPAPMLKEGVELVMAPGGGPAPVEYLATGFMAVHRKVFTAMLKRDDPILGYPLPLCMQKGDTPFYPFYMNGIVPNEHDGYLWLSEDYAFCHRAKACGYTPHVDPSIRLGHFGQYEYTIADLLMEPPDPQTPMVLEMGAGGLLSVGVLPEPVQQGN